jgi:hypothetical protein
MDVLELLLLKFLAKVVFAAFFSANRPLNQRKVTFFIQFIKLGPGQYNITLSVHSYNFLSVFTHKEMFAKNYIIKDASRAENIAYWVRFGRHVFNIYDLRRHISWSSTSHKKIVRIISNCSQAEVDNSRLLTQDNIIWFEITVNYIFSRHLCQSS